MRTHWLSFKKDNYIFLKVGRLYMNLITKGTVGNPVTPVERQVKLEPRQTTVGLDYHLLMY